MRRAVTRRGTSFSISLFLSLGVKLPASKALFAPGGPNVSMERRFSRCLVGGTFDRFHSGHIHLLELAASNAEFIEVWVSDDFIAQQKSQFILPLEERLEELMDWAELNHGTRFSTHILRDSFGPAPVREDCDSIICTIETRGNCERVNEIREENGLSPLEIIQASHLEDGAGGVISSTRIRAGIIDRSGGPWFPELLQDLRMPVEMDATLKEPLGVLYEGPEESPEIAMYKVLEEVSDDAFIVAVGDVCVQTMLDIGVRPDIGIVDGMTKRSELPDSQKVGDGGWSIVLSCINPAGHLSLDLFNACRAAIHSDTDVLIKVEGEEDLAPIPIHLLLPLNAVVLYGQPGKGVVVRVSDEEVKKRCREILDFFEVVSSG